MPIADMRRYAELTRAGGNTLKERLQLISEHDGHVTGMIETLPAQ